MKHQKNTDEHNRLIKAFSVLETKQRPIPKVTSFGTSDITYLCKRFGLDICETVNVFRKFLNSGGQEVTSQLLGLFNIFNLIPINCNLARYKIMLR